MKFTHIKFLSCLVLMAGLTVTYSCTESEADEFIFATGGENDDDDDTPDETIAVESITLSQESCSLSPENIVILTATVNPATAEVTTVTWSSSDESVATVNESGTVTAIAIGEAVITATSDEEGSEISADCKISVVEQYFPVTNMTIDEASLPAGLLTKGDTHQLELVFNSVEDGSEEEPTVPSNKYASWISSDVTIASVINGLVTVKSAGTVTITATSVDNPEAIATCEISSTIYVGAIELSADVTTIGTGVTTQINVVVTPSDAVNATLTWASSDENIATVNSNGEVRGIAAGIATITATATDGSEVESTISIEVEASNAVAIAAGFDGATYSRYDGSVQIELSQGYATSWESSNEAIATVDGDGLVTFVGGYGDVTITATDADTATSSATLTVPAGLFKSMYSSADDCCIVANTYSGGGVWSAENGYVITSQVNSKNAAQQRADMILYEDSEEFTNTTYTNSIELNIAYPYFVMCIDDMAAKGIEFATVNSKKVEFTYLKADGTESTTSKQKPAVVPIADGKALYVWNMTGYAAIAGTTADDVVKLTQFGFTHADMQAAGTAAGETVDPISVFEFKVYSVQTFASEADYKAYFGVE